MTSVYAIVVAYYPDTLRLKLMIENLIGQGMCVVVVNNTPESKLDIDQSDFCFVINNFYNSGMAVAQNLGIQKSLDSNASYICFFDQDSVIPDDYLDKMLTYSGGNIGRCMLAPVIFDEATQKQLPSHVLGFMNLSCDKYSDEKKELTPVDIVISSGMFIPSDVFHEVGMMDDDYFIDFVDIDFCYRLKKSKIPIYIVNSVCMNHSIGTGQVGKSLLLTTMHSPVRTYYKTRNAFILIRKMGVDLFSLHQLASAIYHGFLSVVYSDNKIEYFRFYMKGIFDGLIGVKGNIND